MMIAPTLEPAPPPRAAAAASKNSAWTQRHAASAPLHGLLLASQAPGEAARLPGCQAWPGFLRRPEASEHHRYTARDGPLNPAWRKLPDEM